MRPPKHHFYRWDFNHSQSWLVYCCFPMKSFTCQASSALPAQPRSPRPAPGAAAAAAQRHSAARSAANFAAAKSAGSWALEAVALGGSSAQQMDQKCRKIQGKIGENWNTWEMYEMLGYLRTSEDIPRTCYDLRLRKGQKIVVLPMTSRILLREFIYEMGKRLEFSLFDSGNGMFTSSLTEGDWYKQCKGRFWNSSWWTIGTFHSTSGDGVWRTKECGWQSGLSPCSSRMGKHQRFESSLLRRCKPRNWTKNAYLWNPMNMNN